MSFCTSSSFFTQLRCSLDTSLSDTTGSVINGIDLKQSQSQHPFALKYNTELNEDVPENPQSLLHSEFGFQQN